MALNDIKFNKGEGGLGRALSGEDHISGIVSYIPAASMPAAFTTNPIVVIYSLAEAEALGVTANAANDDVKHLHYQLETLFNINSKAVVYLAIYSSTVAVDLTKVLDVQRFSEGTIRQLGVSNMTEAFVVGDIVILQANADILEAEHKPLSIIYAADVSTLTVATMPDLRAQDAKNVSVVFGTSGNGKGLALFSATSKRPSILGLTVGAVSVAKVNENIGWVARFNVAKNIINEFDVPVLQTGELVKTVSPSALDTLNDKGYIFLIKHIGTSGTYFNDSHAAVIVSSDYAFIENNRTIDKAVRNVRTFLLPALNSPLFVNEDGTLTEDTIAGFRNEALTALEQMEIDGEISAKSVTINPAQNVLTSSKVIISIKIIPVGVARNIEVNIGFAVKLS